MHKAVGSSVQTLQVVIYNDTDIFDCHSCIPNKITFTDIAPLLGCLHILSLHDVA